MLVQEVTLRFEGRSTRQINEIVTRLKARALEMGGFTGMTVAPPIAVDQDPDLAPLAPLPGEDEVAYSQRKARLAAMAVEARKQIADAQTPVESPIVKFNRAFG